MATSTAVGSGSTRNNSGVAYKSNASSTSKLNDLTGGYSPANPRVLVKDLDDTSKAVSAGTFAYEQGATDRPITFYNDSVGGVANSVFSNAAADLPQARKHFNNFDLTFKQDLTTSGIRNGGWHPYSGVFVDGQQVQDVTFATDAEGAVSRSVAGEYQVKGPKFAVETKDYLTKKNG